MIPIRLRAILFATLISLLGVVNAAETATPDSGPGTETSVDVRGDVPKPHRISDAELKTLARAEVDVSDPHDSTKKSVYAGAPLIEVLKAAGLPLGTGMAGLRGLVTRTVVVDATDGYKVVFSLAELDSELTGRTVLLADTKDGQPLSVSEGPFRIIVQDDKMGVRWVRQVSTLTVRANAN
ncbi:MAG: molybdopterin-dependent oxidoreductase [Verrucomicrobia bacterium]|nr:molybdopterin-dependent oxidoreductase [Verrucomicrobiota bacterium]